jgi:uncharacterized membrane protein
MEVVRATVLLAASLGVGLMAGVFGVYANAIMPGLRAADDRTFVGSFQSIDRAIVNPLFLGTFLGALVASGLAAALHVPGGARSVLPWSLAAFVLYLFVVVSTMAVNVPLNDGIKAAGYLEDVGDLGAVRARFDEGRWVRWNLARAAASTVAFGCLLWALVESGRGA